MSENEIYTSTKALSVYNALSFLGADLTRQFIDAYLRTPLALGPKIDADYVDQGVQYLLDNGFISEVDSKLVISRQPNGRGMPLARSSDDRELVWAAR